MNKIERIVQFLTGHPSAIRMG